MKITVLAIFCGIPLFASLAGCRDDRPVTPSAPPEVYSIRVEPASLVLVAGGSAQLAAQADDVRGVTVGGASFTFTSTDPQIVRVTATGHVTTPGRAGRAEVRVASGDRAISVPVAVSAGAAARVDVVEAAATRAAAGGSLGTVRVRVVDAHGNAIGNRSVLWRIVQGGGALIDATEHTEPDGGTSVTWYAGRTAGPQRLEFSTEGIVPAVFEAVAHAGPATQLQLRLAGSTGEGPAGIDVGQPAQMVAAVSDAHGNAVAGAEVVLDPVASCGVDGRRATTGETGTTPRITWTPRAATSCRLSARVEGTQVTATLDVQIRVPRPVRRR